VPSAAGITRMDPFSVTAVGRVCCNLPKFSACAFVDGHRRPIGGDTPLTIRPAIYSGERLTDPQRSVRWKFFLRRRRARGHCAAMISRC
jgi:hypothetical protein